MHDENKPSCHTTLICRVIYFRAAIESNCTNGELRLEGGSTSWEGNVEVCFSGRWGTVCQDNWDKVDAQTTCRLLGFGNGSVALPTRGAYFGVQQDRPIFLDEVRCLGNETGILQCASVDVGDHNCNHFRDAGVICSGEKRHKLENGNFFVREAFDWSVFWWSGGMSQKSFTGKNFLPVSLKKPSGSTCGWGSDPIVWSVVVHTQDKNTRPVTSHYLASHAHMHIP